MKKGPRTYLLVESKGQVVQNILLKALLEVIKGRGDLIVGGDFETRWNRYQYLQRAWN